MKKVINYSLVLFLFFLGLQYVFAYENCDNLVNSCIEMDNSLKRSSPYTNSSYYYLMQTKNSICDNASRCLSILEQQQKEVSQLMGDGYDKIGYGDYEEAVDLYKKAMNIIGDKNNDDYKIAELNIKICYYNLGDVAFKKKQRDKAAKYYNNVLKIDNKDDYVYFLLGLVRFEQEDYSNALKNFKKAYEYTTDDEIIKLSSEYVEYIEFILNEKEKQKKSISRDFFSYRTLPFLEMHNIIEAQLNVKQAESKEVIIAIIDDGIYINHPDLSDNIWVNSKEIPSNGKDDDKNGYKDDYNGWNFVYNNNNLLPLDVHGTMVAGVIGAIRDNNEGIAGITKNVKLMPIGVCEQSGCDHKKVIEGINYAIDNGANIINLSLGGNQFNFTDEYTKVIRRAYNHGIVVVVAAGNGDILTESQNGVNTSVNPLSPICNYGDNKKSIIGVGALNGSGNKAKWSNYGNCVQFRGLGERVFSTIIPSSSNETGELYNKLFNFGVGTCDYGDGTSFSTPIIAGIIGLGYNKYGYVSPDIVRDSLKQSMGTGDVVDANKYLEILGNLDKLHNDIELSFKDKFDEWRYNTKKRINVFVDSFKKSEKVLDSINTYKSQYE